jgi:uncharacterized protein (TIGR02231 family)
MRPATRLVLTVSALVLLAEAAPARADDLLVPSAIRSVTVYEDRALVERGATVTVGAGTTRLVFSGLPAGFDPNSLRARSPDVRVLGVDTERVPLAHEARPATEAARLEWEKARRATAAAELDHADAKDAWERLRSVRAAALERAAQGLGGAAVDAKGVENLLELVDEQGAKARRRLLETQAKLEDAKALEDAARRRYELVVATAQPEETFVVVTVTADAARDAKLAVQYMVGNAGWQPVYDLRVTEDFGATSLEMSAMVRQRTGEDWTGVPMELTTAQPSTGAAPPEPLAWVVDLLAERSRDMVTRSPAPAPGAAAPAKEAREAKDDKFEGFVAPVRRSGVVVAFRSALPATVRSDGQPARVAVGRFDLAGDVRWTAFPRSTDKVFVTAKVKNTVGSALPGGEARVFVGPDYVGPMQLADWGQEKEIEVGLGVDREVEVARETLKQERATEGIFSRDTVHARAYRITLKNHRDRAIPVRILDQTPVSRDEDLKVEVTETTLPLANLPEREAETNKARGVLEWRTDVGPKRELDLRFTFEVRHPKGRIIVGMED